MPFAKFPTLLRQAVCALLLSAIGVLACAAPATRVTAALTSAPTLTPVPGGVTLNYTADTVGIFANPERGFYSGTGVFGFDASLLQSYRNQNMSLMLYPVNLAGFVGSDVSAAALTEFNNNMALIRQAGLKAILRFGYSWDANARVRDASLARVLGHIAQFKPYLQSNADVIATVQAGFIGIWGEWYFTDFYGDNGIISSQQWNDRRAVLEALLNAVPANRTVQVRTPAVKQRFYGASPLSAGEAFGNSFKARLGHHNDCFLADSTDFGTYTDSRADKAYLNQENQYLPQGGETCATSSFSGWANANADMSQLHWSYLNADYHPEVLRSWGSNLDIAKRNLGYRFTLTQGSYSSQVAAGGPLTVRFGVRNDGYAALFNPRQVELVLRNSSGTLYRFALAVDPRQWASGSTTQVDQTVMLTGVPAGNYTLLLNLPDQAASLGLRPEYSIRLANANLWEAATGFNALNHTLNVTAATTPPPPASTTVHIIGDSTVAKYEARFYPLTGWGDRIGRYFKSNIVFKDFAVGGTSAKSFNNSFFAPVLAGIKSGDYLFIQFGHNDCCSSDQSVASPAQTEYKQYLRQYIDNARAKGATPVLITPMNSRNYVNTRFEYNPSLAPYAEAMRQVASEKSVALIDLASKSLAYLNNIGFAASSRVFINLGPGIFPNYPLPRNDDFHFADYGAQQMARLVADGVRENQLEPLASSWQSGRLRQY